MALAIAVSVALHAGLLTIHFTFPGTLERVTTRALDVVLVNSKHAARPTHAQAKAQANLDGGGNTDQERRAATPLPPSAQTREGDDLAQTRRRVAQLESQTRQLLSQMRSKRAFNAGAAPAQPLPPDTAPGQDLYSRSMAIARLEAQIEKQMDDYNKRPRKKFIGARTEEYLPAQYLEDWRQKVERVGNLNYPEEARGKLYGSLVVYLEINAEGQLERAEIQRSSGNKILDQAALRILRLAAPFARFPDNLKSQFDILAFARTWSFTQADMLKAQ
ncbi:energy transducer TonB [Denitratisoma sp. DHT3]|uniref:energy transducer TonB n=1 Tax=Denitratisoma sp. DHT3 TaxID=1981880 RepID=UPI0021BD3CA0|nr:TonB family protein [Denitratisoma sp. DHT3]